FTHCARDECAGCAGAGATSGGGIDDSFSGAPPRGELAVHSGMVLDPRFFGAGGLRRTWGTGTSMDTGAPAADAGVGECARRFSGWVCIVGDFPVRSCVDLVQDKQ